MSDLLDDAQHRSAAFGMASGAPCLPFLFFAYGKSNPVTGWWYCLNFLPGNCILGVLKSAWRSSEFLRNCARIFDMTAKESFPPQ